MILYPLKFTPIFKDKIWGNNKLRTYLKKDTGNITKCGESWELSGVPGNISVVSEGKLKGESLTGLMKEYKGQLISDRVFNRFGTEFPLLVKFIDANEDLSVQVHPDDHLAIKRHNSAGKTEMWYIIKADKEASLISGFNRSVNKEEYIETLRNGRIMDILNVEKAENDDVFFIPAGRVHTIGKGLLLAEIQQTSDITYRIYDFDRTDKEGNRRELHTDLSVDAIDYNYYNNYRTSYDKSKMNCVQNLVRSDYFITNRLYYSHSFERNYHELESFGIMICLEGKAQILTDGGTINISKGDVVLIPASLGKFSVQPEDAIKLLETYIPA